MTFRFQSFLVSNFSIFGIEICIEKIWYQKSVGFGIGQRFGFRFVQILGIVTLLNGTPILIRISDKVVIFGNPVAYDKDFNCILKNTTEIKTGDDGQKQTTKLGSTFIKGTAIQIIINNPNISIYEE